MNPECRHPAAREARRERRVPPPPRTEEPHGRSSPPRVPDTRPLVARYQHLLPPGRSQRRRAAGPAPRLAHQFTPLRKAMSAL